jgi:RimJ/RimL family protein N-acetyltransferase
MLATSLFAACYVAINCQCRYSAHLTDAKAANWSDKPYALDADRTLDQYLAMNLVLYSSRLALTPFDASDVDIAIEMFTDPEVLKFAGGVMEEATIRNEMPNWTKRGGNGCIGIWCISDRITREKLGSVALLTMPVEEDDTDFGLVIPDRMPAADIEIGYFLKRSAWGQGFATEACKRLLQMAFSESPLPEIVATFEEGNTASRNVLEKAGFVDRGTMRCYGEDGPNFRITREEWSRNIPTR